MSWVHFGVGLVIFVSSSSFLGLPWWRVHLFLLSHSATNFAVLIAAKMTCQAWPSLWFQSLQRLHLYMMLPAVEVSSDNGCASHAAVQAAQKQEPFPVNKTMQVLLMCRLSTTRCTSSSTQAYRPARTAAKGPFSQRPFLRSAAPFRSWRYARLVPRQSCPAALQPHLDLASLIDASPRSFCAHGQCSIPSAQYPSSPPEGHLLPW